MIVWRMDLYQEAAMTPPWRAMPNAATVVDGKIREHCTACNKRCARLLQCRDAKSSWLKPDRCEREASLAARMLALDV
jgi:hypothetical protein